MSLNRMLHHTDYVISSAWGRGQLYATPARYSTTQGLPTTPSAPRSCPVLVGRRGITSSWYSDRTWDHTQRLRHSQSGCSTRIFNTTRTSIEYRFTPLVCSPTCI